MLSEKDKIQLAEKGISKEQFEQQLNAFKTGFPFLRLFAPASVQHGIVSPNDEACERYLQCWKYATATKDIVKFVPASGAASRMFKNLFEFCDAEYNIPTTEFEKNFFNHIHTFAFYKQLDTQCIKNTGKSIDELMGEKSYKTVVKTLLDEKGLNYGQLPKGLLHFHLYGDSSRTPAEEHLVEGACYAQQKNGIVKTHFTVSPEHKQLFQNLIAAKIPELAKKYNVQFEVSFSEQKSSTDTIAVTPEDEPFRLDDQSLLFRPGGHGALIENLNDIDADIIFIKNIDNVVPDWFKEITIKNKALIAGILVDIQEKIFKYLHLLEEKNYSNVDLAEILHFVETDLCCHLEKTLEGEELVQYLYTKLNRPIRVCGMVRNVGEPGGGPFLTYNDDDSISLQILESNQIDKNNQEYLTMFEQGTHFNPVDLVCGVRNFKGEKFNLKQFIDSKTGFISYKSKNGRDLKALELPGLWNGSMSNWNTIFVEVPLETFNPVKTVNDLLRPQHLENPA